MVLLSEGYNQAYMQINLHLPLAHLHATSLFKCLIRLRFTSLHWNTFYFHWITTKENLQQLLIFCNNCILNGSNVYFDLWFIFYIFLIMHQIQLLPHSPWSELQATLTAARHGIGICFMLLRAKAIELELASSSTASCLCLNNFLHTLNQKKESQI